MKVATEIHPTLSVIMAVYNGAATLRKTLDCLAAQRFRDFEVIIVNDDSKDESETIIKKFQAAHPEIPVVYLRQKNKGLGGARNTAMRQAHGAILSLLDQDDIWYPEKLAKVAEVFATHRNVALVCHPLYRRVNGTIGEELPCSFMTPDVFHNLLFRENHFCGSAMSFRRELLDSVGFFSEDQKNFYMSEDFDYWLRAAAQGYRFYVLPEVFGEYTVHESNFSKNKRLMYQNEWNVIWRHYQNRPVKEWRDPWRLLKRRGKIFARQLLARLHG